MFVTPAGRTRCLAHAAGERCECGVLIEHDFLTGCGTWRPVSLLLEVMLTAEFCRTTDPIVH